MNQKKCPTVSYRSSNHEYEAGSHGEKMVHNGFILERMRQGPPKGNEWGLVTS